MINSDQYYQFDNAGIQTDLTGRKLQVGDTVLTASY